MTGLQVVLASGGTGGHIYPALAVAAAALDRGHEVTVLGRKDGMEARVVPESGVAFRGVRAGKWDRDRPDPRQAVAAIAGVIDAVAWMRRCRPDAVVGFGGYASFPGCFAAALLRVPLLLYEGNAFPGRVTRWFAPRATQVLATQRQLAQHLPRTRSLAWVGFPVRSSHVGRREARALLGLPPDALVTLVMGGSQGSLALNRAVPEAFARLQIDPDHTVLHSSGPRWAEQVAAVVAGSPGYHVVPYVDATLAWPAADLGITRAGFSTLAEAASFGVPLIAVPLPGSAEDHQRHNAAALEASGAGCMLEESELPSLPEVWRSMLEPERRRSAAAAARSSADPRAASAVVDLLERAVAASSSHARGAA